MVARPKPTGLIILDGWGHRRESLYNAIHQAKTPFFERLVEQNPHCYLQASGTAIGLPEGQMGNSEVGHLSIGAGRCIQQNLTRINDSARQNFNDNQALLDTIKAAERKNSAIHIMGLYSPGGVHSHQEHIDRLIACVAQHSSQACYLHLILDGRDTPIYQSLESIATLQQQLRHYPHCRIATVCGRFYAMDRDHRWQRTERYYRLLVEGIGDRVEEGQLLSTIAAYHRQRISDEFIPPLSLIDSAQLGLEDQLILMNFRVDRLRQITQALCLPDFDCFQTKVTFRLTTLTEYSPNFNTRVAFANPIVDNHLGAWVDQYGLAQLRIAETEKYPHITFFFNGGEDFQLSQEKRILIDSAKVKTYDLQPAMRAKEIADALIDALIKQTYHLFILNFANADMVGHCGDMQAAIEAVEVVDRQLQRVVEFAQWQGWQLVITADHGNAEVMFDSGQNLPHTAHTLSPVPMIVTANRSIKLRQTGSICQIAPTILDLMGLSKPSQMSDSLIQ